MYIDNTLDIRETQRMEDHHVINAVKKLRFKGLVQCLVDLASHLIRVIRGVGCCDKLGTHVARHNDDGVLEAHHTTLTIGKSAVVEQLQQHVEYVRMRLLHLVKKDDAVGAPAHSLGKLATLIVAHVSRRGTDQTRHGVLLHVLAHVDAHKGTLVIKQAFGQSLRKLRLSHSGRPEEEEAADGSVRIREARTTPAHSGRHRVNGIVLPHHTLVQLVFQMTQFVHLALHHL